MKRLLVAIAVAAATLADSWARLPATDACETIAFGGPLVEMYRQATIVVVGTASANGSQMDIEEALRGSPTGATVRTYTSKAPCLDNTPAVEDGGRYLAFLLAHPDGSYSGNGATVFPIGADGHIVDTTLDAELNGLTVAEVAGRIQSYEAAFSGAGNMPARGPAEYQPIIPIAIHRTDVHAADSLKHLRELYGAVIVATVAGVVPSPTNDELETSYQLNVEAYHSVRPCIPQPSVVLSVPGVTFGRIVLRQPGYPELIPGLRYLFVAHGGAWDRPLTNTQGEPFAWFRIANDRLVPVSDTWDWTGVSTELQGLSLSDALARLEAAAPRKGPTARCKGRR